MNLDEIKQTYTAIELIEFGFKKHYYRKNSNQHDYRYIINKNMSLHTKVLKDDYDNFTQLQVNLLKNERGK